MPGTWQSQRELEVDLSFIGEGLYGATLWQDGQSPTDVRRDARRLGASGDKLVLRLSSGGGAAIRLSPRAASGTW